MARTIASMSSPHTNPSWFLVAQIGRAVGLQGDLKLHLHTDFPEQFKPGMKFETATHGQLAINRYDFAKGLVRFVGFENLESAKCLTNVWLYATPEQTKANCILKEGQYLWSDIIGCIIIENGIILGKVKAIDRLGDTDYLQIETSFKLTSKHKLSSHFLIPYIKRYIVSVDVTQKTITTKDAKDILEAS